MSSSMPKRPIILDERLALSVPETATALGVSERHLRDLLPEIPHTYLGKRIVIPVEQVRKWLADRTKIELNQVDEAAADILREIA